MYIFPCLLGSDRNPLVLRSYGPFPAGPQDAWSHGTGPCYTGLCYSPSSSQHHDVGAEVDHQAPSQGVPRSRWCCNMSLMEVREVETCRTSEIYWNLEHGWIFMLKRLGSSCFRRDVVEIWPLLALRVGVLVFHASFGAELRPCRITCGSIPLSWMSPTRNCWNSPKAASNASTCWSLRWSAGIHHGSWQTKPGMILDASYGWLMKIASLRTHIIW